MSAASALWFIARQSALNAALRQLRRLREPRYLLATGAGIFYLWGVLFRHRLSASAVGAGGGVQRLFSLALPLALAVLYLLRTWIFGGEEGALSFSEAEIQFLFPAPVTRRALLHEKLLRKVARSALTALLLSLGFAQRGPGSPLWFFVGAWVGAATLGLHAVAVSLSRASLLQHGASGPLRRGLFLLLPLACCTAAFLAFRSAPPFPGAPDAWPPWAEALLQSRWMVAATLLVHPALQLARGHADLGTAALAAALLAINYLWALCSDADFAQGALSLAQKRSRRLEARRRGQLPLRTARAPFQLGARGHPAVAIFWKNLTAAVRLTSLRVMVLLGLPVGFMAWVALGSAGPARRELGAMTCAMALVYLTLFGSQIYRIDFRLDLRRLELLRTFPIAARDLAAAQVAGPWALLTMGQWLLIALGAALLPAAGLGHLGRLSLALTLAVALPWATLGLIVVQNVGALLFPGWVAAGVGGPRGVEAMGQRVVTLFGTLLVVSVALLPASIVAGVVWLALGPGLGSAALPLAALCGAAVVAVEALFALQLLGRLFDDADLPQS